MDLQRNGIKYLMGPAHRRYRTIFYLSDVVSLAAIVSYHVIESIVSIQTLLVDLCFFFSFSGKGARIVIIFSLYLFSSTNVYVCTYIHVYVFIYLRIFKNSIQIKNK